MTESLLPRAAMRVAAIALTAGLLSSCAAEALQRPAHVGAPRACVIDGGVYEGDAEGFGCATAAILDQMVARAEDLSDPAPLAQDSGDRAFLPAERYRLDNVEPLPGSAGDSPRGTGADAEPQEGAR